MESFFQKKFARHHIVNKYSIYFPRNMWFLRKTKGFLTKYWGWSQISRWMCEPLGKSARYTKKKPSSLRSFLKVCEIFYGFKRCKSRANLWKFIKKGGRSQVNSDVLEELFRISSKKLLFLERISRFVVFFLSFSRILSIFLIISWENPLIPSKKLWKT